MPIELTDDGLTIQLLQEIRDELNAAFTDPTTGVSPILDVSDDSVMGRVIGILSDRESSIQQQMQAIYTADGPDATGVALTRVALLTGTVRRDATFSKVLASVTLNAGTTLLAGSQANVLNDPNSVFGTDVDVTNGGGSPAAFDVEMTALDPGPVRAPAGTLTAITTPVTGWTAITNAADAVAGLADETDEELRARRVLELNSAAAANLDAIITDVRSVEHVASAIGFENTTATTNGDGLPAHSYEIVVSDFGLADDDVIAQAIWDSGPAGIAAVHGTAGTSATGDATDVEGVTHAIAFTRAQEVDVYVTVNLTPDDDYPSDGDAQVKAAVVAYVNSANAIGQDVSVSRLYGAIYDNVAGVADITSIFIGTAPSPSSSANLVIGGRQVAVADTARVVVAS